MKKTKLPIVKLIYKTIIIEYIQFNQQVIEDQDSETRVICRAQKRLLRMLDAVDRVVSNAVLAGIENGLDRLDWRENYS